MYCLKWSAPLSAPTRPVISLEYLMRVPVTLLLAAGLLGCSHVAAPPAPAPVAFAVPPTPEPPTQHAPMCARPPEKAAFDVAGLKSQLMVTALACQSEEKYNAFVVRYRSDLVGDEKSLSAFFGRAYGKRAQQEHDDYITQLANAQSQLGIKAGTDFCRQNAAMLDEVMTLKSGADLPAFAASKPIQQSLAVQECPDAPAPAAKAVKAVVRAPVKKKK